MEAAASLKEGGYDVSRTSVEQRSELPLGALITIAIAWKLIDAYTDEFMREMARESVKALKRAKRGGRRVQGFIRLDAPPDPRPFVEYIFDADLPEEAEDLVESDAQSAPRRGPRMWDEERRRWTSLDELMVEQRTGRARPKT